MTQHTPGPWELHEPTTPSAAWWIWGNHRGPDAWHVVGTANNEADGRLSAAAPDLLQACEATLALAEWIASFDGEPTHRRPSESELTRRTIELIAPLTEAIAKARGQAVAS